MNTINSIDIDLIETTCRETQGRTFARGRAWANFTTEKNGIELSGRIDVTDDVEELLTNLTAKIDQQLKDSAQ